MYRVLPKLMLLLAMHGSARAESLADLLARVGENARFGAPARADVRLERPRGAPARPAILLGRGDALYVEIKDGPRALIRPDDIRLAQDGRAAEAAPETRLGDTDLLLRDLAGFRAASLQVPQISDDGPAGVVVTAAPAGRSPYALVVHTIDR